MILFLWILIQIIGESLPISSSGHVLLMQKQFDVSMMQNAWVIDFLLHGPTIIILLIYFFWTWWNMVFQGASFTFFSFVSCLQPALIFIFIADSITSIFWACKIASLPWIQYYFLPIGFCITAFCLYFSQYAKVDKKFEWSICDAFVLGSVQAVSLLPGISRFASTYAAGVWLGYERKTAFALSFLIQMPLLCAAFVKSGWDLIRHPEIFTDLLELWVFFTVLLATIISYFLFCLMGRLIEKNRLWYGAYYMIIPIVLSFCLVKEVGI